MGFRKPRVLLIGETVNDSSYLAKCLEESGSECSFAKSYWESASLIRQREFDLVLSPARLRDGSGSALIDQLSGSATTLFYYYAVERGCWWLPALRRGQECFGSPALRSREFVTVLDEIINEIRSEAPMSVQRLPFSIPQWRGSIAAVPSRSQSLADLRYRPRGVSKEPSDHRLDLSNVGEDFRNLPPGMSVGTDLTHAQITAQGHGLTLKGERKVRRAEKEVDSGTTESGMAASNPR